MRSLAQRLNSGTATLYRHFKSREDLIAQVVDRLFEEMDTPAAGIKEASWDQACRLLAHRMFDILSHHKNAAQLLLKSLPSGSNAVAQRERSLALLLDNGFAPPLAARAYATLARYVLGFAIQITDPVVSSEDDTGQTALFHTLDSAVFPATFAVANELPIPLEDEFSFGLDLMIEGLKALISSQQGPSL